MKHFTYNNLINVFKDLADRHLMLNDFGNGNSYNIPSDMRYPFLWMTSRQSNSIVKNNNIRYNEMNVVFIIEDKLADIENDTSHGKMNGNDILSDCLQIGFDIISQLDYDYQYREYFEFLDTISYQFIYDSQNDGVYGVAFDITFRVPLLNCVTMIGTPTDIFPPKK